MTSFTRCFLKIWCHISFGPFCSCCSRTGLRGRYTSLIIVCDFHIWILWEYHKEYQLVLCVYYQSFYTFFLRWILWPLQFEIALLIQETNLFSTPFAINLTPVLLMSPVILHILHCIVCWLNVWITRESFCRKLTSFTSKTYVRLIALLTSVLSYLYSNPEA